MNTCQAISVLPVDIQRDWMAQLQRAIPTSQGVIRLVDIRRTDPASFEGQRITVLVVDEDGRAVPSVNVAFAYNTAKQYVIDDEFLWSPPMPQKAFIVPTQGNGQIDQIQGSVVKEGQPGGVTVYILEAKYSSDVVVGAGMLADHTGLHLTFQLQRIGVRPLMAILDSIERRLDALEGKG